MQQGRLIGDLQRLHGAAPDLTLLIGTETTQIGLLRTSRQLPVPGSQLFRPCKRLYSSLRVFMGSTLVARYAGMRLAINATAASRTDTAPKVMGSVGFTP